jgi:peptide chain release factor 2
MSTPGFWENQTDLQQVVQKANSLKQVINQIESLKTEINDASLLLDMAREESDAQEALKLTARISKLKQDIDKLEIKALLNGPFDQRNAYLSLHAGAGGTESCDWVEMLFRMYRRYCENTGFDVRVLDMLSGDTAGIKSITFLVSGTYAYGYFSGERGVHRLVRISPFDSQGRRHTSFASLDVIAEIEDNEDVDIQDSDLRIDTYRSAGAGGQHVNKTDSAVRITHLPTGMAVACQSERSQHMNKATAMKILRARVYEWQQDQKRQEMEKYYGPKGEIGWGNQIRSYVLQPYTLAKDHRTNLQIGNVTRVLEGDLDPFIHAYLRYKCRASDK